MTSTAVTFAGLAKTIARLNGFGSNKMNAVVDSKEINWLVANGYVRTFMGKRNSYHGHYLYAVDVPQMYAGITGKGWSVAQKFIDAYDKEAANGVL